MVCPMFSNTLLISGDRVLGFFLIHGFWADTIMGYCVNMGFRGLIWNGPSGWVTFFTCSWAMMLGLGCYFM
jgi:hypothetical protein